MFGKMRIITLVLAISVVAIFAYVSAASAQFVEDGLVSYWTFDEVTDETVEDVVGGHNGTFDLFGGDILSVDGKFGKALEFDGTGSFVIVDAPDAFICGQENYTGPRGSRRMVTDASYPRQMASSTRTPQARRLSTLMVAC